MLGVLMDVLWSIYTTWFIGFCDIILCSQKMHSVSDNCQIIIYYCICCNHFLETTKGPIKKHIILWQAMIGP